MGAKQSIAKAWDKRVVRFACVGVINTLTDTAILNGLVFIFGFQLIVANVISASLSVLLSYFWNHYLVFRREHPMSWALFTKFVLVTGLSIIVVQEAVILVFQHVFTLAEINRLTSLEGTRAHLLQVDGAKLVAVCAGMVWNFVLYQLVVFKKPAPAKDIDEEGVVPY